MPKSALVRSRATAFTSQHGLCYYCLLPMWLERPENFRTKWNLAPGHTRLRQCTAEHLVARKDGGDSSAKNIVAACLKCNQGRHARRVPFEPGPFRKYVQTRIRNGRWHQAKVVKAFGQHPPG